MGELGEVQVMVQDLAGVVEQRTAGTLHDLFQRQIFQAASGEQFIQVVHVGLKVLAVVK